MAGQFSALIPMALVIITVVLGVFGGLSYKFYELGTSWAGLACLAGVFVAFPVLINVLKGFFHRYAGRMVFALFIIAILGAYFAHLINAPVVSKTADGKEVTEWKNLYPMGNDLKGGTELIYILNYDQIERNIARSQENLATLKRSGESQEKIRTVEAQLDALETSKKTAPDKAAEVVRHRVDPNGTKGIPVTTFGSNRDRLRIQLPGVSEAEVARIKNAIDTQGRLAFHIATRTEEIIQAIDRSTEKDGHGYKIYTDKKENVGYTQMVIKTPKKFVNMNDPKLKDEDKYHMEKIVVASVPGMDGSHITLANARIGQDGRWEIEVRFDAQGSTEFSLLTGKNIKERMAIVLDNEAKSAPTIQSQIDSVCQISGNFTKEESEKLASILTAGSLPAEVRLESESFVGPSLGQDQINSGMNATIIATAVVILFMLAYYRLSGAVAAVCMVLNLPMLLGLMGFFKATLTLPGIAGIVLTLGMAVDANVLILERLREELARGRSLKQAVSHGFDRAFLTIIDCHMTTLFSSVVLYYMGTGPVRGFAVSLSLGILTTLFCNLWLNWILTEWMVAREAVSGFQMMQFFKETNIDFMGNRRLWMTITGAMAAASIALFVYYTNFSPDKNNIYDVDFTGGTRVQFNLAKGKARNEESVRADIKAKVMPALSKNLDEVIALFDANKDKKEAEQIAALSTRFSNADALAKQNLKDVVENLKKHNEIIKKGEELTAQSFGKPEENDPTKFRSFSLTTRIVDSIVSSELTKVLRKSFAGELEAEPVEASDKAITLRLANTKLTKEEIEGRMKVALTEGIKDSANSEIKDDLGNLKVVKAEENKEGGFLQVEIGGFKELAKEKDKDGKETTNVLPAEMKRLERIKQVVNLANISDKIGGPIGSTNAFGAQVAGETGWMSLLALIVANLAVFVYLWFRFEFSGAWGFGAIVALLHDVVIAGGAVILAHALGMPILINLNIVAALLTITGFSVNDTIVVFDRIREVKAAHPTRSYEDIVNEACNATLSRTILTTLTVWLSTLILLVFGGPTIKDMAFTLLVGFTVGTYSSVFIASPLMIWWYRRFGSGRAPVPTSSNRPKVDTSAGNAQI